MNTLKSNIEQFVSPERYSKYQSVSTNEDRALALYCWNIEVSSELFKVISSYEVYIRNAICKCIENTIQNGIFNITFLGSLRKYNLKKFFKIVKKYDRTISFKPHEEISQTNQIPIIMIPKGKIIAELDLYFWEICLSNNIIATSIDLHHGFPNIPPNTNLSDIQERMKTIREVRNRICHNEHLLNTDIANILKYILEIISYISTDLSSFEKEKEMVSKLLVLKP